jgi:predicted DNA-binding transcriptional regulator AlpA
METQTTEKRFLNATDVADILGISTRTAYRIIKQLNDELNKKKKITIAGKVSSTYFYDNVAL